MSKLHYHRVLKSAAKMSPLGKRFTNASKISCYQTLTKLFRYVQKCLDDFGENVNMQKEKEAINDQNGLCLCVYDIMVDVGNRQ